MSDLPEMVYTSIGHSTIDKIEVRGYDLTSELMGEVDFAAIFFLLVSGRLPSEGEGRLFNAVLVALADHGLTPSALAARLTYTGAPEALQGSIAAGLLGGGSVVLGVLEDAGRMLRKAAPAKETDFDATAAALVTEYAAYNRRIPGLGHPTHTHGDPRTARLLHIAKEEGLAGPHIQLMERIGSAAASTTGKMLPLNAAGASGALLCDLGIDMVALRGVALVARSAGLVGHIVEEAYRPLGRWLWGTAERHVPYRRPS